MQEQRTNGQMEGISNSTSLLRHKLCLKLVKYSANILTPMFHVPPTQHDCIKSPGLVARVHQVLDVAVRGDGQLGQVLHVGPHQGMLPHTQVPFVFRV